MNTRALGAAGAAIAALTLGISPAAPASAGSGHRAAASLAPHVVIKGFHLVRNVHMPRTALQHLAPAATAYSNNWSGYAAVADRTVSLRFVSADFNVPSVNCAASPSGSRGTLEGQWIGLDGYSTKTVEQTGIAGYCTSGTPTYYAWWEMYPDAAVMYSGPLNPGDAIASSVYFNPGTHQYNLYLHDVTTGGSINVNEPCPSGSTCRNASAEVISEVPGGGPGNGYDLADFGMENFTSAGVTSLDGTRGNLGASKLWSSTQIVMVDPSGAHMVQPSSLYGGQAFNDTWLTGK